MTDARIGPLNDKQREYTGYIMQSSASLLAIVNDILDLSTIDAGIMGLDLVEVDVGAVVAAAVESIEDRLKESRVRLEVDVAPDVGRLVADDKRIRQILYNLLSNAIVFSPEGSRVHLSASRAGGIVEFTVADEGAGIPSAFVGSAFDRFAAMPRGPLAVGSAWVFRSSRVSSPSTAARSRSCPRKARARPPRCACPPGRRLTPPPRSELCRRDRRR
jgi:K+-sensing histidine kinase KdpD